MTNPVSFRDRRRTEFELLKEVCTRSNEGERVVNGFFDHCGALKDFAGQAPLFPLPDVVVFPYGLMPLHVFEDRYRKMIADVLRGNRLIVIPRLKKGYEDLYHTRDAPIYPTACLGQISVQQKLPDGRYYLIFEGLVRVSIETELPVDDPYRVARLKLHRDRHRVSRNFDPAEQARKLLKVCQSRLGDEFGLKPLLTILGQDVKLGTLCDVLSHTCSFEIDQKQALLEELNIPRRYFRLKLCLEELLHTIHQQEDDFLLPFSRN